MGCGQSQIPAVADLDLPKYMGDWYVIASIPLGPEKNSFNALEQYQLVSDKEVAITFSYNDQSLTGPPVKRTAKGFVSASENSRWGVQFFWPIKAEFVVSYVDADYETTIVARSRRDYIWLMARTPQVESSVLQVLKEKASELGYDLTGLRMVPHNKSVSG